MFVDKYIVKPKDSNLDKDKKTFLDKDEAQKYLTEMQNIRPDVEWTIDIVFESEGF